jgi:hypothetical protein
LNFLDPVATPNSICDTASFARQPGGAVCQELYQCQWRRLCKDAITPGERVDLVASIDSHPTQTFASMVPQTATQNLQQGGITSLHAVKLKRVAAVSGTSTGFVGLGLNFGHYNAAGASDGCVLQKDLHQCPGDIPIALIGTAAVTHSDEAAKPIGPGAQLAEMIIADIIKYFGKTE